MLDLRRSNDTKGSIPLWGLGAQHPDSSSVVPQAGFRDGVLIGSATFSGMARDLAFGGGGAVVGVWPVV